MRRSTAAVAQAARRAQGIASSSAHRIGGNAIAAAAAGSAAPTSSSSSSSSWPRKAEVYSSRRTLATAASAPSTAQVEQADITIVGGGVAGLALACALTAPTSALATSHNPPAIVLIDAGNLDRLTNWPPAPAQAKQDEQAANSSPTAWENRTVSLSADNLDWLFSTEMRDVGNALQRDRTWDVHAMAVSDGLTGATIEFGTDDGDVPGATRLSTMVELSNLQQAMLKVLRHRARTGQARISIRQKTKVLDIVPNPPSSSSSSPQANNPDPWPLLTLATAGSPSQSHQLKTRLLIGADGHGSPVRRYAGIRTYGHDYDQRGLVGTLRCREGTVGRTAYQRFLPSGPIAFLPMSASAASMVWTLPPERARALETIHREAPPELLAQLINAAYRLPWHSIDYLFVRILDVLREEPAAGGSDPARPRRDWSWLGRAIEERVRATLFRPAADVEASGGVPDEEYAASLCGADFSLGAGAGVGSGSSRAPPMVVSVDGGSVASFPLMLRQAEAYTGASLRSPSASPDADASGSVGGGLLAMLKPSRVLEGLMGAAGLLRGVQRVRGGPGSQSATTGAARWTDGLTDPLADGHSAPPARSRTVLVGDAAHTVHPLAGQGLNQGLLDVRALSRALSRAVREEGADLGLAASLGAVWGGYERERWGANAVWASGIDKLGWVFGVGFGRAAGRGFLPSGRSDEAEPSVVRVGRGLVHRALIWGRSTGLEVLNELGPVKARMVRGAGSPSSSSSSTGVPPSMR